MSNDIKAQILNLEKRYWNAMGEKNIDEAIRLTRFPCTISGMEGFRQVTEAEYRKNMSSMNPSPYQNVEIENSRVEVMNDEAAMIYYSCHINGVEMLDASLWIKKGPEWACSYHSEIPKGGN